MKRLEKKLFKNKKKNLENKMKNWIDKKYFIHIRISLFYDQISH